MLFRTHFVIALLVGILFSKFFENPFIFVICVSFFGLLADLDTPFSKIGKRKCFRPIQWLSGHRKIFHSFILVALIGFGIFIFSKFLMWAFLIGYSCHLFADAFTIQGIQPLYPFDFRIKGFIRTGSFVEMIIFVACLFGIFILLF